MRERAVLALEDGRLFPGYRFGCGSDGEGEVVFATCMTGYQEVCTDPSYHGQIVVFTYPLVGNYGVNSLDAESKAPWVAGIVVREHCVEYSNWQAEAGLDDYLDAHGVPGLFGVDTRALTRHLRTHGTMRGVIASCSDHSSVAELVERARRVTPLSKKALVEDVSARDVDKLPPISSPSHLAVPRIAVVDCGVKQSILRALRARGAELVVLPFDVSAQDVLQAQPDGIVFTNGPGDPAALPKTVECLRTLLQAQIPILGICLGHQILALAVGGTTSRLKFGHHGGNHPVKDLVSGRVCITSQNHEFQVDAASIPPESGFRISHVNLNDGSVEGLAHRHLPVFSVQYHPEGSPGPQDDLSVFDRFVELTRAKERR